MTETRVQTYRDRREYEQDLERQARDGWIVTDATERYPRVGCLAAILAVMRWRSHSAQPQIIVTYQRNPDELHCRP